MGGVFGDKSATLNRPFARTMSPCYSPSDRLVLKHDDVCYSVHDLLSVKSVPIPKTSDGNEGVDSGRQRDAESERCKRDRRFTL
jgi:hypothetical protein